MRQQLIFTNTPAEALDRFVAKLPHSNVFVITDTNVARCVLPLFSERSVCMRHANVICCEPGDENKTLDALCSIWMRLNGEKATRSSLVINVGGGMITDMGGFAAATFKRGLRFVNIPTTLLAAVDASVGGKIGINFNGFKNEIGVFAESEAAIISTAYFSTLSSKELLSGYAEMLKHALLRDYESFVDLLDFDITVPDIDNDRLLSLLQTSVEVKRHIVEADMRELGIRRALNLGHTIGHAFESYAMMRHDPIPHGYAVAWGIVVELVLSNMVLGFPSELLRSYAAYVHENYGIFYVTCDDYPALIELMGHDKKNKVSGQINFSLLRQCGDVCTDITVDADNIKAALDIYRDLMGI